jgi:phospholipid transport system substrate-binding protein
MIAYCLTTIRRSLFAILATVAVSAAVPAQAGVEAEAGQFIEGLAAETVALAADTSITATDRAERLRSLLQRGFDTEVIARFVLGKYWRDTSEEQRRDFMSLFRDYTVASYARRFEDFDGHRLTVLNARNQGGAEGKAKVAVASQFIRPGAEPVRIEWRVRQTDDGWRIYDVVVEGISMVLTQRSEFAAVLQRSGGNIDGLLEQLRATTVRLEGTDRAS